MMFELPHVPDRSKKTRESGVTMVMDKGLSTRQAEDLVNSAGEYVDLVKFGFGTSLVSNNVKEKIKIYQDAGIDCYLGGTLFEAFVLRGKFEDYQKFVKGLGLNTVEVSDGSMELAMEEKLECIRELAKDFKVLSEVGSKQAGVVIAQSDWLKMMQDELEAGSWKVIAEARESGNVGIYNADGSANIGLIDLITNNLDKSKVLWEAPIKRQAVWFIKMFGPDVNLGNIAPEEVIPLETLRLGLRGDTFFDFVPENLHDRKQKLKLHTDVIDFQI